MRLKSSILAAAVMGGFILSNSTPSYATSRVLTDNQASKLTFDALIRTQSQWNSIARHSSRGYKHNSYAHSYARNYSRHGRIDHLRYSIQTVSYRTHGHHKTRHHYHT